jgi:hypothetical protein
MQPWAWFRELIGKSENIRGGVKVPEKTDIGVVILARIRTQGGWRPYRGAGSWMRGYEELCDHSLVRVGRRDLTKGWPGAADC